MAELRYDVLRSAVGGLNQRRIPPVNVTEFDPPTAMLHKALGLGPQAPGTVTIQSGKRLERFCADLLNETVGLARLSSEHPWRYQRLEMIERLRRFFSSAGDNPAVLWSHGVCWTDRATARFFSASKLEPTRRGWRFYHFGQRVPLRFELGRKIYINTGDIAWLVPEQARGERILLVKTMESLRTTSGGLVMSGSHRETLGVAVDIRTDAWWLRRGLFPGLQGKVYSLLRDGSGHLVGIKPTLTLTVPPRGLNLDTDERSVYETGILDVNIVKAWRLWPRCGGEAVVDELCFALDRLGRTASVAVSSDRFAYLPGERFEEIYLAQWVAARL